MYCPRCGQQQISDEMRFCSRCGLPMGGLAEWISGGGSLAGREQETQVSLGSPGRKRVRRGAKLLFFSGVLFPVFLVISLLVDDGAPMVVPVIFLFVALTMMIYSRLFVNETSPVKSQQAQTSGLGAKPGADALPPANVPIYGPGNFAGRQVSTNELAQPRSVTEHTTKLLDKE